MKITSTYSVRLRNFNRVFDDTVEVYRHAVDYFIELVIANWNTHFANLSRANDCIRVAEGLSVRTKKRLMTPYNFCHDFMKFPSYLRRAAIMAAYGQVSSYKHMAQWKTKTGAKGTTARSAEGRQKLSGHVPRQYVHQSRTQQRETQSSHSQYLGLG